MIESRREGLERFLSIVAGHPLLQVCFLLEGGWLLACIGWIWWSGTYMYIFRLEAKCSALSYKTPLGIGRNGSKRRLACDEETHDTCISTTFSSFTRCWRGGARGAGFFSCPNCTWSMRWSVMVWDVIFIAQSSNPLFFFSILLFLHLVHFSLPPPISISYTL